MKTGLVIGSIVVSTLNVSDRIPLTPGLMQSIQETVALHMEVCKRQHTPKETCEKNLDDEMRNVRAFVDKVCKEKAPKEEQAECASAGIEWMLDNKVIPAKISALNHKSI